MVAVVYLSPDVRPTMSLGTAMVLIVVAGMSSIAARVSGPTPEDARRHRFFLLSAAGAAFLGLDDLLGIHESIGLTLHHWVDAAPRPERVGHVVLGLYAVVACVAFWSFRDLLRASPRAQVLFAVAAGSSVAGAALDTAVLDAPHVVTHPLQITAAIGLLLGYWTLIGTLVIEPRR